MKKRALKRPRPRKKLLNITKRRRGSMRWMCDIHGNIAEIFVVFCVCGKRSAAQTSRAVAGDFAELSAARGMPRTIHRRRFQIKCLDDLHMLR